MNCLVKTTLVILTHLLTANLAIITKHRRLYLILSKHLAPFQALKVFSDGYNMYRLYPTYETRTLTGRIMTNDPNLQCVPNPLTVMSGNRCSLHKMLTNLQADTFETTTDVKDDTIVLRDAFRASHDHILISADFHQLELRIIAHLSGDEILIGAFKQKQDIFLSMASQWFNTPYAEVDPMQRKKVHYLIVMGHCCYSSMITGKDCLLRDTIWFWAEESSR